MSDILNGEAADQLSSAPPLTITIPPGDALVLGLALNRIMESDCTLDPSLRGVFGRFVATIHAANAGRPAVQALLSEHSGGSS